LPIDSKSVLSGVIEQFLQDINTEDNWIAEQGYDRVFGYSGVQQFILDIHYLSKLCDPFLSESSTKSATDCCSRALKIYFRRFTDPNRILKPGDWYDRRVAEAVKKGDPAVRAFLKRNHQSSDRMGSRQDLQDSSTSISNSEPAKASSSSKA
jgi:hypothetical protein